jgi:drug/metabolite transporter (DMT)-like permease
MQTGDFGRLICLAALWGGSFLFIRVAAPVLGPVVLVELRVLIAGLALLLYAAIRRRKLELRAHWRQYLIIGALNSALPFVLISTAELRFTASFAAILNATSPLFGAIIAAVWLKDRLTVGKIGGLILGILGVAVLVGWSPISLSTDVILSIGASLLGAASYGVASVYTKAHASAAPPFGMAVGSQLGASLLLLPLVPAAPPTSTPSASVALCVLLLALGSTALAYLLYFRLIVDIGPARALTVTFITPIFGISWGALILGEQIAFSSMLGCAIILAGTTLVLGIPIRPRRTPAARALANK